MELSKKDILDLTYHINGAAFAVHRNLGPGLLEKTYQTCMCIELRKKGFHFISEMKIPFEYDGHSLETNFRCDLFVNDLIVLELKSVDSFTPLFDAQILTYMKLLNAPKGILYNFNVLNLYKDGQRTLVNEIFKSLPQK